jgi:hypothetical protein
MVFLCENLMHVHQNIHLDPPALPTARSLNLLLGNLLRRSGKEISAADVGSELEWVEKPQDWPQTSWRFE